MSVAVQFADVRRRFGEVEALAGVSLAINEGECFALLGPNGAGKTTLISCLAGLVRPDSGDITVRGCSLAADPIAVRRLLGIVPQELVYDSFFTVRELLQIQAGYFGLTNADDWINELLARLELADKADIHSQKLSGGMKRRLLIALALVHRPPVIVLDEPTAGVDIELRQGLWRFIGEFHRAGHTIILTTHYLDEAEAHCDRIALLKQGQIIALDHTAALLSRFAHTELSLQLKPPGQFPFADYPGAMAGTLSATPTTDAHDRTISLPLKQPNDAAAVLNDLAERGLRLDAITITPPNLESAFVAALNHNPSLRHDRPVTVKPTTDEPATWPTQLPLPSTHEQPLARPWAGFYTLTHKEIGRFFKVSVQTLTAPTLTALLYLLIFASSGSGHRQQSLNFMVPGLVMMNALQNAFANASSSLLQSRVTGNLVFLQLAPLSPAAWYWAYTLAATARGLAVALGTALVLFWFGVFAPPEPLALVQSLLFLLLGCACFGALGLLIGLWAEKFDHLAAGQHFVILPLTMLSGVFYRAEALPTVWQPLLHANPVYYLTDGFRYGWLGVTDIPVTAALLCLFALFVVQSVATIRLIGSGWRLTH